MDGEHKIRLMLIEKDGVKHYCLVKNISALLASQVSKDKRKQYFCDRCLNPFWCEESLNKHLEYCSNHKAVKIKMPDEGTILKFKNYHMSERVPFMTYADTESLTKKILSCEADPEKSYIKKYQKHELISFSYHIKCFDDTVYRMIGAAHNSCNVKYRKPDFTHIAFHNLAGYDIHLFIKELGFSEGNICMTYITIIH